MKYQDMKIRDIGRMATIGVGLALVVAVGLFSGKELDGLTHGVYLPLLCGIGGACPLVLGMCVYYLLSSPEQNGRFIHWAERHRWGQPPLEFDWTLLDPSDPNFRVPTFRYFLAKRSVRKGS